MLLRKIPKRNIVIPPGEFKDAFRLMKSSSLVKGHFVDEFENAFKRYVGAKEAIVVSSGRSALNLILRGLGLKEGDGILLSAFNFRGVPKALLSEGFRPVFVDADKDTYQINIDQIEEKIDGGTKAIIATHLFGQPCDLNTILDIARKHHLFVIEDAAHSIGSYYDGKHTGTIGDAGFFSFSGSKTINTSFGGMVTTNNTELAGKIREESLNYNHPGTNDLIRERFITYTHSLITNKIFYSIIGYPITVFMSFFNKDPLEIYKSLKSKEIAEKKMQCTNVQACIGLKQMDGLQDLTSRRKKLAEKLFENLPPSIPIQKVPDHSDPNFFMIAVKSKDKHRIFKKLLYKGIDSNIDYASNCSYLTKSDMPAAKLLSEGILTINLPFDLSDRGIIYIANALNTVLN